MTINWVQLMNLVHRKTFEGGVMKKQAKESPEMETICCEIPSLAIDAHSLRVVEKRHGAHITWAVLAEIPISPLKLHIHEDGCVTFVHPEWTMFLYPIDHSERPAIS